jgi:hypothetical protein
VNDEPNQIDYKKIAGYEDNSYFDLEISNCINKSILNNSLTYTQEAIYKDYNINGTIAFNNIELSKLNKSFGNGKLFGINYHNENLDNELQKSIGKIATYTIKDNSLIENCELKSEIPHVINPIVNSNLTGIEINWNNERTENDILGVVLTYSSFSNPNNPDSDIIKVFTFKNSDGKCFIERVKYNEIPSNSKVNLILVRGNRNVETISNKKISIFSYTYSTIPIKI